MGFKPKKKKRRGKKTRKNPGKINRKSLKKNVARLFSVLNQGVKNGSRQTVSRIPKSGQIGFGKQKPSLRAKLLTGKKLLNRYKCLTTHLQFLKYISRCKKETCVKLLLQSKPVILNLVKKMASDFLRGVFPHRDVMAFRTKLRPYKNELVKLLSAKSFRALFGDASNVQYGGFLGNYSILFSCAHTHILELMMICKRVFQILFQVF